ncbi:MAG: ThiF family adenylyltransferase, partial [Nanoarchaeota archaeon]|nr:ThiF family adenylyltransferase [Nanoarchaeota archaeon]MBU1975885.1 ThiF family adenylyltransferase [Nanoarchaeota archaeon]
INKFKAKEAKKNLERQNSRVKIKTFHEELVPTNSFLLDSDVVIDSTNDINTSLIIDKNCKKPLLVCRYAGDSGIVFNKTATINVKKLQAKLEKDKKIEDIGIFNPTVCLAASILVSESMKILLKKKPIKGLISFNSWNHTIRVKK